MATYQTWRNGLPARVSRQFEEEYEQPLGYQVSSMGKGTSLNYIESDLQMSDKHILLSINKLNKLVTSKSS